MDLSRPVGYRGVELNDAAYDPATRKILGNRLNRVEWMPVEGQGYREKRALADGMDASDIYLADRTIVLHGTTFGATKGDVFDRVSSVNAAFTPTSAYAEDPGAYGFLPLDYYMPTEDTDYAGERHVMILARPPRQLGMMFDRDKINSDPAGEFSIDWAALAQAKDPRVYAYVPVNEVIPVGAAPSLPATDWENKGNYPTPVKIMLVVAANAPANSKFHFEGGGGNLDINIPSIAYQQVFRYDSSLKVLTVEVESAESLRMDLLVRNARTPHPLVLPGVSSHQWAFTGATTVTGGHIWFNEAWA